MPFQITGAIARMPSPYLIPIICAGRYTAQSCHLSAYGKIQAAEGNPTQDPTNTDGITWVEVDIELSLESSIDAGRQRSYQGQFRMQDFNVDTQGNKGILNVMHQWNIELQMNKRASGS